MKKRKVEEEGWPVGAAAVVSQLDVRSLIGSRVA